MSAGMKQDNKHYSERMAEAAKGLLEIISKHKSLDSDAAIKDIVDFCRIVYRNGINDGRENFSSSSESAEDIAKQIFATHEDFHGQYKMSETTAAIAIKEYGNSSFTAGFLCAMRWG